MADPDGGPRGHAVRPALGSVAAGLSLAIPATNASETAPLVLVLTILSVIGAVITFGVLVWAIYKFRDPATKGRRYG